MRVDDLEEALGGDIGLRRLGIVLVDHRNLLAQRRDHVGEVGDDLCFRFQAGEGGNHDAAGASIHRNLPELDEVCGARVRHADDNGHAAVDAAQEMARELSRLLIAELLRFAHHPENRQALHAQSMSPASVKGVAEIVYTPFADASSSWRMVLTSLGSRFLPRMSSEQIYTLRMP